MTLRSYAELRELDTYEDRFRYLVLGGGVGAETFGMERYLNQEFYRSSQWRRARNYVIDRDRGCDLGIPGYDIHSGLVVHHMNPIEVDDLLDFNEDILDPEFLITTTLVTHNGIHYGSEKQFPRQFVERSPGDTVPWR